MIFPKTQVRKRMLKNEFSVFTDIIFEKHCLELTERANRMRELGIKAKKIRETLYYYCWYH